MLKIYRILPALLLLVLLGGMPWAGALAQDEWTPAQADAEVTAAAAETGAARVIVNLRDTSGRMAYSGRAGRAFSGQVAMLQDTVIAALDNAAGELRGTGIEMRYQIGHRYQFVPAFSAEIDSHALAALLAHPLVSYIEFDQPTEGHMTQSVPAINADDVQNYGFTGAGVRAAVLDSGIPSSHPDINPDVIATTCFTGGNGASLGNCSPSNTFTGASAFDAPYPGDFSASGHGTNVTGIITSDGVLAPRGFAPDVEIAAVRVLDGRNSGWVSDWVAGLDWVIANQATYDFDIINMSLGTGALYNGSCEAQQPSSHAAVQTLVNTLGIVIFASSGNQGSSTSLSSPACLPNVIAVGATYDSNLGREPDSGTYSSIFSGFPACFDASSSVDTVTCFSNTNAMIDVFAPGRPIQSAGLNSNTSTFSGTSQAAPTAAGIAALLLQYNPYLTPAEIENTLELTGIPITDAKNGVTRPRIDALAAFNAVTNANVLQNGDFSTSFTGANTVRQWEVFGAPNASDIQWQLTSGVLEFRRVPPVSGSTTAAVLQNTGIYLPDGAPIELQVTLGSTSSDRQRVSLLAHDADFSDLQICTFWLPANTAPRLYRMTFNTRTEWTDASLSIYASTASTQGYIQVDNAVFNYEPTQVYNGVVCYDPSAPPANAGAPDGMNILSDSTFSANVIGSGDENWGIFTAPDDNAQNIDTNWTGGVFQFYRKNRTNLPPQTSNSAALLQYAQDTFPTGTIIEAVFNLGNSTPDLARITVLLHRRTFTDLAVCTFYLPPNTPLTTFTMRAYSSLEWSPSGNNNPMISFYSSTGHTSGWLQVDNATLMARPSLTMAGTECYQGAVAVTPAAPEPTLMPYAPAGALPELPLMMTPTPQVEGASAEGSISE